MASGSNGATVQFTPVSTGDLKEIPPDLPAGAWTATCKVKRAATNANKHPMLILNWKTTEDLTGDNENAVGQSCTDFVVFSPSNSAGSRMGKIKFKAMCEALDIEIPASTKSLEKGSWDDLEDLISALDGCSATIYTSVTNRKDTGEATTNVKYTEPGASLKAKAAADDEDEDEDEAPAKKSKTTKKAPAKTARR